MAHFDSASDGTGLHLQVDHRSAKTLNGNGPRTNTNRVLHELAQNANHHLQGKSFQPEEGDNEPELEEFEEE